ncbi:stalk domain-containing protein [Paenibacillus radicis (ex Xue et al. 2023)]|uniref:Stalk domain-containing protein n=1 Tax=Paenibacillus radicis (ex Xue et al. 2023) TaxID=2972489 RepID=A0ABT1YAP2_9BACL|nr:stalk domain-containing protein [Paenibacillus radicis (ex Xue et al. 2023)]MCR8630263.1 stalk domain-containing protein [Paenibacillus radicis (ex Xue et al. 2023)]
MKLSVTVLLVLLLSFTGAGTLFAADQKMANDQATVQVDGRNIVFPDAKPYSVSASVYLPVRIVAENMGIPVIWDVNTKSVRIGEGDTVVTFKPEATMSGNKPFLKDNRVYVDLTFIQDKLGAGVVWTKETMAVSIKTKSNVLKGVQLYKQSMVKLTGEKVIYVDPYKVDGEPMDGDIIFITHTHGDHFNINDIQKVAKKDATIVFPTKEQDKVTAAGFEKVVGAVPNEEGTVEGISYKAVPAYNTQSSNHPKDKEWVGYIIKVNGASYYMAGDTDLIPEMKDIDADVAFLPMGGTYTMAYEEAAKAANIIHPRIVIPYHYADVVGTRDDAVKFIDLIEPGITAILMKE